MRMRLFTASQELQTAFVKRMDLALVLRRAAAALTDHFWTGV
jgi:hypothetical protein